jgi:hypothetical protein
VVVFPAVVLLVLEAGFQLGHFDVLFLYDTGIRAGCGG